MKKVLLLGDSIRMNYCDTVKDVLGDGYEVAWPNENCRFARYMLNSLRFWLNLLPEPDAILFNAGIWDIAYTANYEERAPFTSRDEYTRDLCLIAKKLLTTGAKVTFVTTSAVRAGHPDVFDEVIREYNDAAVKALTPLGVAICDLHAFMEGREDEYVCDDLVHLSEVGKSAAGAFIAGYIKDNT